MTITLEMFGAFIVGVIVRQVFSYVYQTGFEDASKQRQQ